MIPSIELTRNKTGEKVSFPDSREWDGDYMWSMGNYSCQCNRALFFERNGGSEITEDDEAECGHGAFSVRITEDGELLYEDNGSPEGW
jgi:hypothetical protein